MKLTLALGAMLVLPAVPAFAAIWSGDGSTGDLSQWSKVERVAADRISLVSDGDGGRALRFTVQQGDDPIGASGNRAEVVYTGDPVQEGAERWYSWQTLWPDSYAAQPTWQLFTQWHHTGTSGSPPVEFFTNGERVHLRVNGTEVWSTPLVRGLWHAFELHVRWSANKGWVEVFLDGKPALQRYATRTLFPGEGVYLKQGLYRNASISADQTILHRRMEISPTRRAPAAAPEPEVPVTVGYGEDPAGNLVGVSAGASGCTSAGLAPLALLGLGALARRRRAR